MNKVVHPDGSRIVYLYDDVNQLTDEEYYGASGALVKAKGMDGRIGLSQSVSRCLILN